MRAETLAAIGKWIADAKKKNPNAKIDRNKLLLKIQVEIGATEKKAEEYLKLLGDYEGQRQKKEA